MFEHLIITDRILTLIMFGGTAMLLQEKFFGKNALICLIIENLIMFSILFILKKRKKTEAKKTDSLSPFHPRLHP